jgi:hypothetical protein
MMMLINSIKQQASLHAPDKLKKIILQQAVNNTDNMLQAVPSTVHSTAV